MCPFHPALATVYTPPEVDRDVSETPGSNLVLAKGQGERDHLHGERFTEQIMSTGTLRWSQAQIA